MTRFKTTEEYAVDEQLAQPVQPAAQTLDIGQLVKLVTAAVQAAQPVNGADLAAAITAGITASQPARQIDYSEYIKTRSVHRDKPSFTRRVFQNGYEIDTDQLSAENIAKVNKAAEGEDSLRALDLLSKPYVNGLVTIGATKDAINFRWNNSTIDKRLELQAYARDFGEMLDKILAAQAERLDKKK